MPSYVTREEFEARVRVVESEVEGEKAATRHILEQTRHNGDDLGVLKVRVDRLTGDVALANAALTSHTAMLKVIVQDVGQMRTRQEALARDVVQMHTSQDLLARDLGQVRTGQEALAQHVVQMHTRQDGLAQDLGQVRTSQDALAQDVAQIRSKQDALAQDVAAIRAAVAPRDPAAGA